MSQQRDQYNATETLSETKSRLRPLLQNSKTSLSASIQYIEKLYEINDFTLSEAKSYISIFRTISVPHNSVLTTQFLNLITHFSDLDNKEMVICVMEVLPFICGHVYCSEDELEEVFECFKYLAENDQQYVVPAIGNLSDFYLTPKLRKKVC